MIEAWHFLANDRRIARYNGAEHSGTLVVPGQTLKVYRKPVLCTYGFHASVRAIDALGFAPGNVVQRVRMSGDVVVGDDKLVATERTCLWVMDASIALHVAAVQFAQAALDRRCERGALIDRRSQAALDVKLRWLEKRATDAELDAARAAAWAAARDAAWAAARAAARDAAQAAARAAARDAAQAAARAAARDAARAAAWAAARDAERTLQDDILGACLWTQYESKHGVFA